MGCNRLLKFYILRYPWATMSGCPELSWLAGKIKMDVTAVNKVIALVFLTTLNYANAQNIVSDQTRYFELNAEILNELCLDYAEKQYKGQFALGNNSGVYALKVISAAELPAGSNADTYSSDSYNPEKNCVRLPESTRSIHYNITSLVLAEGKGFFPTKPLSELVDFWSLKTNPSGVAQ